VTPILTHRELEKNHYDQRPAVTLKSTPALAIAPNLSGLVAQGQGSGVVGGGWISKGLVPGVGGEALLRSWAGWKKGTDYTVERGALAKAAGSKL
jgi:alpha-methylacyl-CoA racemase